MSDLDKELEKAIAESEADAGRGSAPPGSERPVEAVQATPLAPKPTPRRNLGLLLGLLVIGGGVLAPVMTSANKAAIYSVPTDELVAHKADYAARNVRVEGTLVKGSLRQRAEPCEYRFTIEKNGKRLPVRFPQCVVPDTFRDAPGMDVQVTAEGRLSDEGHFEATNIMAKCPSKYEMQEKAAKGEKAPHAVYGMPPAGEPGTQAPGAAVQAPTVQAPAVQAPAAPASP
jgi:cytochrome c-type biogenesis protein CcmE